jgi:monoterpene epsilon-lactone hydrolase
MSSFKSRLIYWLLKRRLAQLRALDLPLPQLRALRDQDGRRRFKLPRGIAAEPVLIEGLAGEWLRPAVSPGEGVVLYLHGGAYVQGSVQTHRALAARLALASDAQVLLIDYRLAPEHPFPAALDDALAVYGALQTLHPEQPIALAGDSAGGGLALAAALRIRDLGLCAPAALALLSPWTDLSLSNASHQRNAAVDPYFPSSDALRSAAVAYAAGSDLKHPLISPQFASLAGLPPALIHVGDREALLDDACVLAQRMEASGGDARLEIYPGMWHVWQIFGGRLAEADASLAGLGAFLRLQLSRQAPEVR